MEHSKSDWQLYQNRIGAWQERYMERLEQEYVGLLNGNLHPSEKFWELHRRMQSDQKKPGVKLILDKKEMQYQIIALLRDGAISMDDLNGFSEELIQEIKKLMN